LILDASAVVGAGHQRRGDFSLAEIQSGQALYFEQQDNRSSGQVVYRAKVQELSQDRMVIAIQNVTGVRLFLLTLFDPGDLQSLYILQRLSPGVWGFYSLTGVREVALTSSQPASYVNRAVAIYRHIWAFRRIGIHQPGPRRCAGAHSPWRGLGSTTNQRRSPFVQPSHSQLCGLDPSTRPGSPVAGALTALLTR
jgi:hypothetical protein